MNLLLLEPTWDKHIHLPNNLGWLKIVRTAFPKARLSFVGDAEQQRLMHPQLHLSNIECLSWQVSEDSYRPVRDLWFRHKTIRGEIADRLKQADRIVMLSCTPSSLNALSWRGLAGKTLAFLHGNANDLLGWRSRHPIARQLDFTASLQRFCRYGGTVVVLEKRLVTNLTARFPWLTGHLIALPHPILEDEGEAPRPRFSLPVQIGFVGNASLAKGFKEFCQLAHMLKQTCPGKFQFHAIGKLADDAIQIDQSALDTPAALGHLSREAFNQQLQQQHFMFQWHSTDYYDLAASGVIYDAINQGIPMIARNHGELAYWAEQQRPLGLCEDTLDAIEASLLTAIGNHALEINYLLWQENLRKRKAELSTVQLAIELQNVIHS